MKTTLSTGNVLQMSTDLLVVPVTGRIDDDENAKRIDKALGGYLLPELRRQRFGSGERKEFLTPTQDALPCRYVLFVVAAEEPKVWDWYLLAESTARAVKSARARQATIVLKGEPLDAALTALTEGITLARYEFNRFRSRPSSESPLTLVFRVPSIGAKLKAAVARGEARAAATYFARDLANTPAAALPPRILAQEAKRLAGKGLTVRVHDQRALNRMRMGALLGVGQGSREAPCLIEMVYRPRRKARRRVALVGKGITFDSGGLSLKPAESMQSQKRDMAGGAVVLGVMHALPRLDLPIEVRGYVPAAENMPDGAAIRPGDVLRAHNGKTIEVLNTDAEGRLVLADALSYASSKRPDVMIDFATLTAAVRSALGTRYAAVMSTNQALTASLIAAGADVGENLWELPLVEEYRGDLDSRVADLKNIGEGHAGTIIGGLFLREFVGGVPWAHIDFSSTVMSDGYACNPKGASGYGVRMMLRYLEKEAGG